MSIHNTIEIPAKLIIASELESDVTLIATVCRSDKLGIGQGPEIVGLRLESTRVEDLLEEGHVDLLEVMMVNEEF